MSDLQPSELRQRCAAVRHLSFCDARDTCRDFFPQAARSQFSGLCPERGL